MTSKKNFNPNWIEVHITAADRNRTGTGITTHGILSPGRLPVPPLRQEMLKRFLRKAYVLCTVFSTSHQWAEVDSNHRSKLQQIYSLSPLATRESTHMKFYCLPTDIIQINCLMQADDRTRTDNLLITNQLLCQLSHIGISMGPIGLEPMTLCL